MRWNLWKLVLGIALLGCGVQRDELPVGFVNQTHHSDADLWVIWKGAQATLAQEVDMNPLQRSFSGAAADIRPGDARALKVMPHQLRVGAEPDVSASVLLAATGLDRIHMPRLVEGTHQSGIVTASAAQVLQIPQAMVAGGGGDNAASAVGLGVVSPTQAFLSLGTSGVLFVVTDRFRPNPNRGAHAFCHCLPQRWHQMSVLLSAASALDWAAQLTARSDLPGLVEAARARGLSRHSPLFLPYLSGERTPHNDPNARGVFFGITPDTDAVDLAGAVLEGVALAFADGLDVLLENGGAIGDISMTGGGARLPYWGELLAAALGRPLSYRRGGEVGAALGAARLAQLASSGEPVAPLCAPPPIDRVVEPDPELSSLLAARRHTFARLYRDLRQDFVEHSA